MTRIESVAAQPDRAGRYTVKFDDGSTVRLYRQTVEDFGLYAGKELEDAELSRLRDAAGKMSARMRAVRIVASANVSKGDLRQRLIQKGESRQDAEQAVAWMSELDLVDDAKTAAHVVESCIAKGYGIARARQALYEKRIPKTYWDEALQDYPDQTERILSFLRTKLGAQWEERDLRRATDALVRRGHSYGDIRKALQQFLEETEIPEDIYD